MRSDDHWHDLAGRWALARLVRDEGEGKPRFGRVCGELAITEQDGDLHWREHGILHWGGRELTVGRHTILTQRAPGEWWMTFEDGRPFHPFRPIFRVGVGGRAGAAGWVEHPCAADLYRGVVCIDDPVRGQINRMRILWDVTGPNKSQRLVTRLDRQC
jgi:hypothetical protein